MESPCRKEDRQPHDIYVARVAYTDFAMGLSSHRVKKARGDETDCGKLFGGSMQINFIRSIVF